MSYRALYRQYRPATFSEMIGQGHITTILKNQVASGQTAHAYLFAGTRGTGKTSAAKILARAVNCQSPEEGEPCLKCEACLRTAVENADIIEMDAASNSRVEDIRDIIDKARFVPLELKQKVYIIDEAHALSNSAFNALLKTLEEPPAHVMFILATTEPHKIPATIISRCQRMDFHRLTIQDMVQRMQEVLDQAGARIDPEGMAAIARAAEGGMRDCLSLADQCLSFCGNDVSAQDVYSVLGGMEEDFLFRMGDALIDSAPDAAMQLMDGVVRGGRDLKVFLHDMTMHMRALLIAKLCGRCSDVLDCTEDAMTRYIEQARRAGEMRLLRANELLLQAEGRLRTVTLPRVLIESTLVRIAMPEDKLSLDDLLERVELLEAKLREGVTIPALAGAGVRQDIPDDDIPPFEPDVPPAAISAVKFQTKKDPAPRMEPGAATEPKPRTKPPEPADGADSPQEAWKRVSGVLNKAEPALAVMAVFGKAVSFDGGELVVRFDADIMYKGMTASAAKIQAAAEEAFPGCRVRLVKTGQPDDNLESRGAELFGSAFRSQD